MSVKPILFSAEMVRAILDGRKTVTRRVVKPRYKEDEGGFQINRDVKTGEWWVEKSDWEEGSFDPPRYVNPPYRPGDILYVRETWALVPDEVRDPLYRYCYKADEEEILVERWHPSIHMPREAARIFLRVTDVRVERLQDMRAEDSLREGVKLHLGGIVNGEPPLKPFADLWDSTIKPADRERYGWAANPFCWVIEFEQCEEPEEV